MRKLHVIAFLVVAILLSGCSSIMRPPPAAAYMDSYKRDDAVRSVGFTYYAGNLDNGWHDSHKSEEYHISHSEWWGDGTFANYISGGYFTFGWGFQSLTPFLQGGFVSPYFGLTTWSNLFPIYNFYPDSETEGGSSSLFHYSGGAMAIQQIPLNDNWKIGITEHVARNGRETYYVDDAACEFFCIDFPRPRPKFYTEMGGGIYVSRKFENSKMSLEFRYGRDIDENRNRFAATISVWGFSSAIGIGGNDQMRKMAKENEEKQKNTKFAEPPKSGIQSDAGKNHIESVSDSSLGIKNIDYRWFRIKDSTKVTAFLYKIKEAVDDTVKAVPSNGICYDKTTDEVLLRQKEDSSVVKLPLADIDYCDEAKMRGFLGTSLLEGALMFLPGGLLTGSTTGGLIVSAVTALGFYTALKIFNPQVPKVNGDICSEPHSMENTREWFKQYPCSGEPAVEGNAEGKNAP